MFLASQNKLDFLQERARMLHAARSFFFQRNIMEVDCPAITNQASVDAHIDLFEVHARDGHIRYLHSSPEYIMKRLLSEGINDIYHLGHVYRDDEVGERHNPEFMMAEWYRRNFTYEQMIEETLDFCRLFLKENQSIHMTYRQALQSYAAIDYVTASKEDLLNVLKKHNISLYEGLENEDRDAHLNLILGTIVEPNFNNIPLLVLKDYPSTQAALARTEIIDDEVVAKRFEIYSFGLELANGYYELTQATEQKERFIEANKQRLQLGKKPLPIDDSLIQALSKGIGDCCGVAVGFDRLLMLKLQTKSIKDVLPFDWIEA
ncbi:MAG: EF-P lysine aminoacylase GenX [Parachlamydiales bacterium]|nr:EF-P lysine aminoacylase GenX [Parachlamydiales bacterium]